MKKLASVAFAAALALAIAGNVSAEPPTPAHVTKHSNRPTPAPTQEIGTAIHRTNPTAPPTDVE